MVKTSDYKGIKLGIRVCLLLVISTLLSPEFQRTKMWTSPQGVSRQPQRVINSSAFQRGPSVHDRHLQLQHSHQVKNWRKALPLGLSSFLRVARYKIPRRLLSGSGCTNPLLPLPGRPWFDLISHPDGSYLEATEERGEKELRGNHPGTKARSYTKAFSGGGGRTPPTYLIHLWPLPTSPFQPLHQF